MAQINRAALAEHLWPGIIEWFGMDYVDYPEQYNYAFDTRVSTKAFEEYVMQSGFGLAPVKNAGSAIAYDEAADSWKGRVDMLAYALGFVITREAVEDDQYFDLIPRFTRALRRSMMQTKETRGAAFVDAVFTTSTTGDGKPVCAADHPLRNGDTFSNVAGVNAGLNETSLEAAMIQIADFVDDRGLRISTKAQRMIVPNGLQYVAERLTRTTSGRVGTADHDIETISSMARRPRRTMPPGQTTERTTTAPSSTTPPRRTTESWIRAVGATSAPASTRAKTGSHFSANGLLSRTLPLWLRWCTRTTSM